jgi:hypothetical protein
MKLVYDVRYTATGSEGSTITVPEVVGKKILLLTRQNLVLDRINQNSGSPSESEFTWNDSVITLGIDVEAGDTFLILYRTY